MLYTHALIITANFLHVQQGTGKYFDLWILSVCLIYTAKVVYINTMKMTKTGLLVTNAFVTNGLCWQLTQQYVEIPHIYICFL